MRARQMLTGQNEIDARRYGIRSSATADQTVAFQTMADDLNEGRSGAKTIILPAGEIHVDGSIDFDQSVGLGFYPLYDGTGDGISGPNIRGQGRYATKIVQEAAGVSTFRVFNSGSTHQVVGVSMQDFMMLGPGLTDADTRAIQLGGVSADQSDIIFMSSLKNLSLVNFANPLALDDCTNILLEGLLLEGFNFGIEFGFNIDILTAIQCGFGSQPIPLALAARTSIGSDTVNSVVTTRLLPGMRIISTAFPQGTTIVSVGDTSFVASANATAVVSSLSFCQGVALSYNKGTFTPAYNTPGNANAHAFLGCWFMKNAESINVNTNSAANIKLDSCYFESCNRIATLQNSTSTGPKYVALENCHFSKLEAFQDYAIYEDLAAGGSGRTVVRNCRTDGTSAVPWVRLNSANSKLDWDNNHLPVASGSRIHVFDSTSAFNPPDGTRFSLGCGGTNTSPETLGVTGTLTPKATPNTNCTIKVGPMTGNVTLNDVSAAFKNAATEGQRLRFIIVEDGTAGHAVTWNAAYHFHTAWTNSTVTTDANKRSYVEFEYTGSVWMQVSPANTWIA